MNTPLRVRRLLLVMALVAAGVEVVTLGLLYRSGMARERETLGNVVRSQARLLEAVARFDRIESTDYPGGAEAATLDQFRRASVGFRGMGNTGELTLARRDGDRIVFIVRQRGGTPLEPLPVAWAGELAEPSRRALRGEAGWVVGKDYRGVRVLAAYEPVGVYGLAMVAKVDLAEIRAAYLRAGALATAAGLVLVLFGAWLFLRFTGPLVRRIESSEEEAQRLAQRYQSLFEESHAVMLLADAATGRIVDANPTAIDFYGYSREELLTLGLTDLEAGPPTRVLECLRDVAEGRTGLLRTRQALAGGQVRTVTAYLGPVEIPEGRQVLAIVHDVTREAEAEAALARQRELFEVIFDHAPAMVAVTDAEGRPRVANRALRAFVGATGTTLGPVGLLEALFADEAERSAAAEALTTGDGSWADYRTRGADGAVLDAAWSFVRLADGSRLALGRDITPRKQMERELRGWNADLEARVLERTERLAAANRELEAFSYSVSHDLKAPLRAIDGFSAILEQDHAGGLDEDGRRVLGVIRANALRMGRLIDDLLAFSRLGRAALTRSPVEVRELVEAALKDLAPELEGRRLEVSIEDLPTVHADRALLYQAILNLVSNAVKFTAERDPGRIRIGARRTDGGNLIFVEDDGVGFDPRYAHMLFGVFQRLHHEDEFPGTGVGLAHVRRIVERHGGRVWGEGRPGEGATFWLELPLTPSAAPGSPRPPDR